MRTTESVAGLWKARAEIAQRNKQRRLALFFPVFVDVVQTLAKGKEYTPEQMRLSVYWQYIRRYRANWQEEPLSEQAKREMQAKFQDAIDLFHDIRQNGMRDPLEMFWQRGKRYLILGYRRLVILHVLGIPEAEVWTHANYGAYRESRARLEEAN